MGKDLKKDYYYLLGVSRSASQDEIRNVYLKLAKKFHPDLNPKDAFFLTKMKDVQEAYDVLSDPVKRARYNSTLSSETVVTSKPITPQDYVKQAKVFARRAVIFAKQSWMRLRRSAIFLPFFLLYLYIMLRPPHNRSVQKEEMENGIRRQKCEEHWATIEKPECFKNLSVEQVLIEKNRYCDIQLSGHVRESILALDRKNGVPCIMPETHWSEFEK